MIIYIILQYEYKHRNNQFKINCKLVFKFFNYKIETWKSCIIFIYDCNFFKIRAFNLLLDDVIRFIVLFLTTCDKCDNIKDFALSDYKCK